MGSYPWLTSFFMGLGPYFILGGAGLADARFWGDGGKLLLRRAIWESFLYFFGLGFSGVLLGILFHRNEVSCIQFGCLAVMFGQFVWQGLSRGFAWMNQKLHSNGKVG